MQNLSMLMLNYIGGVRSISSKISLYKTILKTKLYQLKK